MSPRLTSISASAAKSNGRTKLTEHYGIELPFVSAGMGFIATPPLAAAVSNAGGLGQLANGGSLSPRVAAENLNA
jgi:NAD(P)H-dependent flavin oxidoreductase YrpB (nitropropane dioxygenase family)